MTKRNRRILLFLYSWTVCVMGNSFFGYLIARDGKPEHIYTALILALPIGLLMALTIVGLLWNKV